MKYAWIDAQRQAYDLATACAVLDVNVSGDRAWKRGGTPVRKRLTDAQMLTLSFKNERVHGKKFAKRDEVKAMVFEYIEAFHNRKRLHSTLGYKPPARWKTKNRGKRRRMQAWDCARARYQPITSLFQ